MKQAILVLLCIFFVLLSRGTSKIVELDIKNFDVEINRSIPAFIEFYTPWCGHCKKVEPEFVLLDEAFSGRDSKVIFGKVNCDEQKELCFKYGVTGYPTFQWFPTGQIDSTLYTEGKTAEEFTHFVNSKTGLSAYTKRKPVLEVTDNTFQQIVFDNSKHVLIEFYAPWCKYCQQLEPIYDQLANAFASEDNIVIAKINGDMYRSHLRKYYVDGFPSLVWFSKDLKDPVHYEGDHNLIDLVKFINKEAGTKRSPSGRLLNEIGLIPELDELVSKFFSSNENQNEIADIAISKANIIGSANAKVYARAFKESLVNPNYATNEILRVEKLLTKSVRPNKADELYQRINILQQFLTSENDE